MRHYSEMNTIMKCIICYSRLDFTTHSLCRFSYTEFPWAVRALCWCKREQKLLLLCVYSQHTSPLGEASTLCVCATPPASVGAVFSNGSSVPKMQARCCTSPLVQLVSRVCSAPKYKWLDDRGLGTVFTATRGLAGPSACTRVCWGTPLLRVRGPAGFVSSSGFINSTVPVHLNSVIKV